MGVLLQQAQTWAPNKNDGAEGQDERSDEAGSKSQAAADTRAVPVSTLTLSEALTHAVVIDTSGMDRVLAIDTERLVVKVEPGVTLRQLRDVLTRRGLTLPSWPMLLD